MINKENAARIYGILLATMFATVVTVALYRPLRGMTVALTSLFVASWAGFYLVGVWIFLRKFPTSSHELRRQRKELYTWLRSQGRR
jgi:hypothetical protein